MTLDSILASVKRHAEDSFPFEACGLLGTDGSTIRCANIAKSKVNSFEIADYEFRIVRRQKGISGVYHSHVDSAAYLSERDVRGWKLNGLYIVASVIQGICKQIRVWHVKDGRFTEVRA